MAEREAEKSAHCLFHSYETREDLAKSIFPWKMDVLLFSGFLIAFLNKQTAEKGIKKEKQRKRLQHGFGFSARNLLNSSKLSFLILASGETDELNDLLFTIRIFIFICFWAKKKNWNTLNKDEQREVSPRKCWARWSFLRYQSNYAMRKKIIHFLSDQT